MHQEPKAGTRVFVRTPDGKMDLGYGTYMGLIRVKDIPGNPISPTERMPDLSEYDLGDRAVIGAVIEELSQEEATTPLIVLDSGDILYGLACWWREADEKTEAVN